MTSFPKRRAVTVGLFVAVACAILAGATLTIGNLNDTFAYKDSVSVILDEVNGLKRGDNIWFNGVKVGKVAAVGFSDGSHVTVRMRIDRDAMPFVHADALAKIGSDGLIGNRIVVLYGGSPSAPTLRDGDVLAAGKAVSSEEIMTMLQKNNANLLAITDNLKGITQRLVAGDGTIGKLLVDDALAAHLDQVVTHLDTASSDAQSLAASLSSFATKLDTPGTLFHDLVNDKTTYAALGRSVGSIQHAGERASSLVEGLESGVSDPDTPIGTLAHDTQAGSDLKKTLENLKQGSALMNEDLDALKHNFLFRGYFRGREKAAVQSRTRFQAEASVPATSAGPSVASTAPAAEACAPSTVTPRRTRRQGSGAATPAPPGDASQTAVGVP
jgi:phospholipid/cholesterol/gamma-HCH transport system substrate-binding protein